MGFATIIGIDLGKFKSVACVLDAASRRPQFHTFEKRRAAPRSAAQRRKTRVTERPRAGETKASAKCQGQTTSINPLGHV